MSKPHLLLALDSGSQSSRALLFDATGRVLSVGRRPHAPMKHPEPGAVEQDPIDIRDALFASVRECLANAAADPAAIAGLAVTTQRSTVLPAGENGVPLADAVSWLDRRTASLNSEPTPWIRTLLRTMGENSLIPRLLAKSWPRQWRERQPEILDRIWKILPIEGWLNQQITGRAALAPGGLVGPWPWDGAKRCWSSSNVMRQLLGYREQRLPDIVPPGQLLGRVTEAAAAATGLPVGLPVYACGGDKQAEALGAGVTSDHPDVAAVSLGTGSSICVPSRKFRANRKYIWITMAAAEPEAYCYEYLVFRGMWTARWFVRELARDCEIAAAQAGKAPEELLVAEAATVPPGCDGLVVWPRWSPTLQYPSETGAAVGLRETHTRGHFFRALLEGIAFDLRRGRGILEGGVGLPIRQIRVGGGGARAPEVVQILADVLNLPVVRPQSEELAARGAAMTVALGAGVHPDVAAAVAAMVPEAPTVQPRPDAVATYDRLYRDVYLPGLDTLRRLSTAARR